MSMSARLAAATIAVLLSAAIVSAQPPPPPPRPPEPTGTAVIKGRVFATDTGKPLRRARVTLLPSEEGVANRTATSGPDGRYEFTELPAGRYEVTVFRSGYLTIAYGQHRPLEPGKPLQLLDKQKLDNVDFTLPRMSVIAGRITDESGEPIANVRVFLMRSTYFEGRRRLVPAGESVSTDEAGQYRMLGVVPGSYFVLATLRETFSVTENRVERVVAYGPTYFPGTASVDEARRVTVRIGEQVSNTDFSLISGRASNVSGVAIDSHGRPLGGETVYPSQEFRGPAGTNSTEIGGNVLVAPDGTFTVKNLAPGEYKLNMHADRPEGQENGATAIVANGANLENLTIMTSAGWSITGRVTTEDWSAPSFPPVRMRLAGRALSGDAEPRKGGGNQESGRVKDDWTFAVTRLYGPQRLRVLAPDGWSVKAVLQDGRDITDALLAPKNGETVSGVQVILVNRTTSVVGQLTDDKGAPLADATIIVFAADAEKWAEDSRFVKATRPDQQGQYRIAGLPPGEYLAIAVDYVQDGLWNDPEYLESMRRYAQRLTLTEGGAQAILLKLTTP